MIPLKLQLRNFISYGSKSQTIDFEPFNLICLVGKNGHGKSALLDALTWVIWGQARKISGSSKADEGLLKLGETNMMVCLDFICNKTTYRIRREFSLIGKKPHSILEFGILDQSIPGEPGQLRPLTDKTIRATQEKIDTLIGINYESFINSAFLRQGQSNEFSKKTAKERKDILGSILGLDKFEKLKKISLEKNKEALTQKEYYSRNKEQLTISLEQKSTIIYQLNQVTESVESIHQKDLSLKASLEKIKKDLSEIATKKQSIGQLQIECNQLDLTFKDLVKQIVENFKERQETFRKKRELARIKDIDQTYGLLIQRRKELQALSTKKFSLKDLYLQKKEAERNFIAQTNEIFSVKLEQNKLLEQEHLTNVKNINQRIQEHNDTINKLQQEYALQKSNLESLLKKTYVHHNLPTFSEILLTKRKNYYHKYIAQIDVIQKELENIHSKQELITLDNDPSCPLCKQSISDHYKRQLVNNLDKTILQLNHKLKKLTRYTQNLTLLINEQEQTAHALKSYAEEQKILNVKIGEAQKQLTKLDQEIHDRKNKIMTCNDESTKLQLTLAAIQRNNTELANELQHAIAQHPDLCTIKQEILNINKELFDIEHALLEEPNLNQQIVELEALKTQYIEFINSLALQEQRKIYIKQLCTQAHKLKALKKEKLQELNMLAPTLQLEQHYLQQEQLINEQAQRLSSEKEMLMVRKGSLDQQLLVIKQKESELLEQKKLIAELEQTSEDYKAISQALGKDGIQALLIEDAIPEIEQEANALLGRLTDNQSHLSIESVRDLKTGGTKETLDIKISDPIGVRPYELFSGGEAFRIDFALRIAISKLLARRAGTSLETLIIDEGFGSQDEEGLSNIMEVIYKIQNDFEKVIIVSHLPSMKEQFPVNFLVHKGPQGSQIKVIDQG